MNLFIKNTAFVIAGGIILCSCGDTQKAAPNAAGAPIPVNLFEAHKEKVIYYDKFPGTVTAMMQVDIRPEVEGYVMGIFFQEGGHVRKGQKLYEIDTKIYNASKSQAEANLKVAKANLDQAQKDADRYSYLNEHDAVAKQTLDHALTTLQNAKNQVAAAQQDVLKTETDLNYAFIKAPFDGTIGISQVKVGNTVSRGQTVLNTISTDNPMAVDFVVNEKQIQRFARLEKEKNTDSIFSIILPDNTIYKQPGKILFMDRGVNPQTGTITVRLVFKNDSSILRAGMSCNVRVKNSDTTMQIQIPGKAIVEQMGEYFVFIAKDTLIPVATQGSQTDAPKPVSSLHAIQRKVMLGPVIADKVVIKSGINEGENIIIDGVQRMRDGSDITLGKPADTKK